MGKYALLFFAVISSNPLWGVPTAGPEQEGGVQTSSVDSPRVAVSATDGGASIGVASSPWLLRFYGSASVPTASANPEPITFSIYAEQSLGPALWSELQIVPVGKDGRYVVMLGAKTPGGLPADVFATSEARWLGVRVGDQEEGSRILLVAVPYAFKAMEADRLAGHSANDFVTSDALQSAVQRELSHQAVVAPGLKPMGARASAAVAGAPASTVSPATNFVDNTTNQVVLVQQNGTGVGLSASAPSNVAVLGTVNSTAKSGIVAGLEGVSALNNSYGMFGYAVGASNGVGVQGRSDSVDGIGLQGWAVGTGGIALNATASAGSGYTKGIVARVASPQGTAAFFINNAGGPLISARTANNTEQFSVSGTGNVNASGSVTSASTITGSRLISTAPGGTAPLQVASSTQVPNLNASLLGGSPASSFALSSGSGNYIQNGTSQQAGSNFNISGNGTLGGALAATVVNTAALHVTGPVNISGTGNGVTFPDGTTQQTASPVTLGSNVFVGKQEAPSLLADTSIVIGSDPVNTGQVAIMPDNLDTVHSWMSQPGNNMRFRLSRALSDPSPAPKNFFIIPYYYGMAIEYPGVVEVWSTDFSVHTNNGKSGNASAHLWVGDELDLGGLYATANYPSGAGPNGNVTIAADRFVGHTSHGKMYFTVRNPDDAFVFNWGPYQQESPYAAIKRVNSGVQNQTNVESYSGTVIGAMVTDSINNAVRFGSRSAHPVQIFTSDGASNLTAYPSGNVAIGQGGDVARLAVGDSSQFQVSSAGAVTIGSGTPIIQHISVAGSVAFPSLNANSCQTVPVSAVGASDGDTVALGVPGALSSIDGLTWFGFISAQDTASIRVCNVTVAMIATVPSGTIRVDIWKH